MILGLDTSCYTTSAALVDEEGRLLAECRRPLSVESGQRGLRQSDGLFTHVKQLPPVIEGVFAALDESGQPRPPLLAVAASTRPRPQDGSYMPVFLAGSGSAQALAAATGCPFFAVSHQEGHLEAALASAELHWTQPYLALHLSGGTGELLRVTPEAAAFRVELIGGCDLPPGQFIDRVGVALGLPFPAGPHLEQLAGEVRGPFRLNGFVRGTEISFSGPESAAQRAIAQGVEPAQIAAAVLDNIAKSLAKAIIAAREQSGCQNVLAAGGVAANQRLRRALAKIDVRFAAPHFAGDNAYGVARLGAQRLALAQAGIIS